MSDKLTKNIPVHYAIPGRQILLVVGGVFLLIGGIMAMALAVRSGVGAWLGVVCVGFFILLLLRHINGQGEASMDESGLEIVPRRFCFCAGSGLVRMAWSEIERVQTGATNGPNQPRPFVMLRLRNSKRSWIITPRRVEDADFADKVLEFANAARNSSGTAPLVAENPYDSPWWRVTAVVFLLAFAGGIIGIFVAGKAGELSAWGRLLVVGAFAFPFAQQVFGARSKK